MKKPHALFLILAAAWLLRLAWALVIDVEPVSDSEAYLVLAQSLASGRGYAWADGTLTAFWPPGTSFVYSALFAAFGQNFLAIVFLHLVAGTFVVYLGYRVGYVMFGHPVALLSAIFLALWPVLIQFTTILASEILFLVPVLLALLLVLESSKPNWFHFIAFGLLLSIASYIRPTAAPLIIIIPVLQAFRTASYRQMLGWVGIGCLVYFLAIMPWSERNTRLYSEPTGISTNFGANLWMGNNPDSLGTYQTIAPFSHITNERQRDKLMRDEATRFIAENPVEFLKLGLKRLVATFDRETIGVAWNIKGIEGRFGTETPTVKVLKIVSSAYWYAMLATALIGLFFLIRQERWLIFCNPIFMLIGFFSAIPAIMVGQDRYHMPLIPLIACLAAYAITQVAPRKESTAKI